MRDFWPGILLGALMAWTVLRPYDAIACCQTDSAPAARLSSLMAKKNPFGTEIGGVQEEETLKPGREQLERIQVRLKNLADQMVKIRRSHRKGLTTDEDFRDEREAITEEAQQLQEQVQRLKDEDYSEEQG